MYRQFGLEKRLTEQDIVDRAAARGRRHNLWHEAYLQHRRYIGLWAAFFLLLLSLMAAIPFLPAIFAWLGK